MLSIYMDEISSVMAPATIPKQCICMDFHYKVVAPIPLSLSQELYGYLYMNLVLAV